MGWGTPAPTANCAQKTVSLRTVFNLFMAVFERACGLYGFDEPQNEAPP